MDGYNNCRWCNELTDYSSAECSHCHQIRMLVNDNPQAARKIVDAVLRVQAKHIAEYDGLDDAIIGALP